MRKKPTSRTYRWAKACEGLRNALEQLQEVNQEYTDWREGMPDNLEGSPTHEKLVALEDIDLDELERIIEEAENADLPIGFGRD